VSLRHVGVAVSLALLLLPWQARAQDLTCTAEDGCETGGPCPLKNLPYEEFIAAAPTDRGGRTIPAVADRPFDPESGDKILVKGFVVDGVLGNAELGVTQETVQAAANVAFARETGGAAEGRMTVGHMVRVSDEVTTFYRSKGYLVAKAFLPVQTIGPDSIVHIQVIEGKVADVVVEGAKDYSPTLLRKPSEGLIGTVPTKDEVESALLYTQDYPGVRLFGTFKPGNELGETKLVLQVLEEDSFGFSVGGDNYGNEFTGTYRARADMAWKNPIGWGDQFDLTVLQAMNPANTTFGSLSYRVPVGPPGMAVFVGGSQNAFSVAGPLELLRLEGTITVYEAALNWQFRRYRFSNAKAGLLLAHKESKLTAVDTLQITDDKYEVLIAEVSGDRIDTRFKGVDQGLFKVRAASGGNFGSSSGVDESFTIEELRYVRLQSLAETQTAVLRMRGQFTGNVLSPLEQFALSGPDAVRAYPVGQALTDSGYFASLEYRVQAPGFSKAAGPFGRAWGDLLSTLLFFDYASGEDTESTLGNQELSGYGLGLQFAVPGTFNFLIQGANPLSSAVANDGDDFRVYGEFSWKF
jgi:hemolysin activation/secretion protein